MIVVERALSLTQPWASLVAIGAKRYETRSWRTHYRGWLAIHASKGFPNECRELALEPPFNHVLHNAGFIKLRDLQLGQVIAIVELVDCISTDIWTPARDSDEYAFGDYSPGRWAWKLENIQRLGATMEAKGALGLWRLPFTITADEVSDLPAIFRRTIA